MTETEARDIAIANLYWAPKNKDSVEISIDGLIWTNTNEYVAKDKMTILNQGVLKMHGYFVFHLESLRP